MLGARVNSLNSWAGPSRWHAVEAAHRMPFPARVRREPRTYQEAPPFVLSWAPNSSALTCGLVSSVNCFCCCITAVVAWQRCGGGVDQLNWLFTFWQIQVGRLHSGHSDSSYSASPSAASRASSSHSMSEVVT